MFNLKLVYLYNQLIRKARPIPPIMRPAPFEGATLQDDHIPFPRSSGARFCSCGQLQIMALLIVLFRSCC